MKRKNKNKQEKNYSANKKTVKNKINYRANKNKRAK